MILSELRTATRNILDCDDSLFTDSQIDLWLQEAADRVHRYPADWEFLDTTWSLSSAASYVDYTEITDSDGYIPKKVERVNVPADGRVLEYRTPVELQDALVRWGTTHTGDPLYWSERGGRTLILGPAPSSTVVYSIQGERDQYDWIADGASGTPDMPAQLHPALYHWAVATAYGTIGESASAMHHFDKHEMTLSEVADDLQTAHGRGPLIVGGGEWRRDRDTQRSGGSAGSVPRWAIP